jgi:tetratricopeptide (TPR) repeat protein
LNEPLLLRALAIREQVLGPHHPRVAESLEDLAMLYHYNLGRYVQAEPLYKRVLAIREETLGPACSDVAKTIRNLADLYGALNQFALVESLYRRALAIEEMACGPDYPLVVSHRRDLACLYKDQGHYEQAESIYKRMLEHQETEVSTDEEDRARKPVKSRYSNEFLCDDLANLYLAQDVTKRPKRSTSALWRSTRKTVGRTVGWWLKARVTSQACTVPKASMKRRNHSISAP